MTALASLVHYQVPVVRLLVQGLAATWTLKPSLLSCLSAGLRKPRQKAPGRIYVLLSYYAAFGRGSEKDGASLTSAAGTQSCNSPSHVKHGKSPHTSNEVRGFA